MHALAVTFIALVAAAAVQSCGQVKINPVGAPAAQAFIANQTGEAVIGGTQAMEGSWPWTVSICIMDWFGNCNFHAAGAIISPYWVVTTWSGVDQGVKDTSFRVRAGSTDMKSGGQFIHVEAIYYEGTANIVDHYDDVAIIKLATPLRYNDYVQPICVPKIDSFMNIPGKQAWFTAWGYISSSANATQQQFLRQASMTIVDSSICIDQYIDYHDDVQLCVGGGGNTTCNYDMGGPLMQKVGEHWYLYGLSATKNYRANNCASASIFTRMSQFCDWLTSNTGVSCI